MRGRRAAAGLQDWAKKEKRFVEQFSILSMISLFDQPALQPSGKHRSSRGPRADGISRRGHPRRKGEAGANVGIRFLYCCLKLIFLWL